VLSWYWRYSVFVRYLEKTRIMIRATAGPFDAATTCSAQSAWVDSTAPVAGADRSSNGAVNPSSGPTPDPFPDAPALEALEKKITTLASRIHAATHRLLTLIAEFDRRGGWKLGGHRSCADWLSYCTGIDLGTAREKVRTARALVGLPETSASMARGELAFSKVRALTRRATPENEGELLKIARDRTTAELERVVRAYPQGSRADEAALERERHESRRFSVFPDFEGMYVVRGRLPAEVGALLMRAIEAASDVLYREEGRGKVSEDEARAEAGRRRADAMGLLAERALAAGFGAGERPELKARFPGETEEMKDKRRCGRRTEAEGSNPNPSSEDASISSTRAERYQVMLHVELETLEVEGEKGRSELEDGTRVSPGTSRRLSCDCGLVRVRHGSDGAVLAVGRKTRTIPPALRRALEVRDGGCRFPGCGSRFTEGHHVVHWADGGETSLANTLLLCRYHHRLVHEGLWRVHWRGRGEPVFIDPRGKVQRGGIPVGGG
jgi:hypothetical protein